MTKKKIIKKREHSSLRSRSEVLLDYLQELNRQREELIIEKKFLLDSAKDHPDTNNIHKLKVGKAKIDERLSFLDEEFEASSSELNKLLDELKSLSKLKTIKTRRNSINEIIKLRNLDRNNRMPAGCGLNQSIEFDRKTLNAVNVGLPVTVQKIISLSTFFEVPSLFFVSPDDYKEFLENLIGGDGVFIDKRPSIRIQLRKLSDCNDFDAEMLQIKRSTTSLFNFSE